jgi:hypothetical protein
MNEQFDDIEMLRAWLEENEGSISWLARQTGWSREMLSHVINRRRPLSRKLAGVLREKLGIDIKGDERARTRFRTEESSEESEFVGAVAQLVSA